MATTRLGLGGPSGAYLGFAPKSAVAVPVDTIELAASWEPALDLSAQYEPTIDLAAQQPGDA